MAETEFGSQMSEQDSRFQEGARKISQAASETWDQTRQRAGVVRERTEVFLRENPVPTVLGALVLGLAIGLAIRYSSRQEEPTLSVKRALKEVDWSTIMPAFLPSVISNVKKGYQGSAEAVKSGLDRVKEVDVDEYVKPLRKRWNSWMC